MLASHAIDTKAGNPRTMARGNPLQKSEGIFYLELGFAIYLTMALESQKARNPRYIFTMSTPGFCTGATAGAIFGATDGPSITGPLAKLLVEINPNPQTPAKAAAVSSLRVFIFSLIPPTSGILQPDSFLARYLLS